MPRPPSVTAAGDGRARRRAARALRAAAGIAVEREPASAIRAASSSSDGAIARRRATAARRRRRVDRRRDVVALRSRVRLSHAARASPSARADTLQRRARTAPPSARCRPRASPCPAIDDVAGLVVHAHGRDARQRSGRRRARRASRARATSTSRCATASTIRSARSRGPMRSALGHVRAVLANLSAHYGDAALPHVAAPRAARATGGLCVRMSIDAAMRRWRKRCRRVADAMFARDRASQGLGMRIAQVGAGRAELSMTVRADMVNGHAICHGGFIFTLADSAFAFACNSYNSNTVALGLHDRVPGTRARRRRADRHRARSAPQVGRTGVYDIEVTQPGRRDRRALPRQEHADQGHGACRRRSGPLPRRAGGRDARTRPRPDELEPIERASRDELRALQLERLQWSLAHAYENVPHYRAGVRRGGRASARPPRARRSREVSVHDEDGPARQLSVRHVRRAARAGRAHPRVVGHDRQADRRRLHARTTSTMWADGDGALDPRGGRPAPATSCTSRTATASSPAGSARTTAPRSSAAR